jgi:hypothetical protein
MSSDFKISGKCSNKYHLFVILLISLACLFTACNKDEDTEYAAKELLAKLEEEGFISIRDGFLYPTQTGLALADSLSLI